MNDMQRDLGRLEGRVDALESKLSEIKSDVKSILALVNQARGGWRTLIMASTVAGAVGAFITKVGLFVGFFPR